MFRAFAQAYFAFARTHPVAYDVVKARHPALEGHERQRFAHDQL